MSTKPIERDEAWSESSDDEIEDEDGVLVTQNIDQGINAVLEAIRNNPDALKDKSQKFYPDIGEEDVQSTENHKPVFLKDYQRQQILEKGGKQAKEDQNEETYADEQNRIREDLIKQFGDHGDEINSEDDDDALLKKRDGPERDLPEVTLPDPEKDAEAFLGAFVSQKGWIPTKKESVPTYKEVVGDDQDSDEFDDLSEKFENAYNFRFEDPNAAEIVSYARDQSTLRRGKLSSRQKKREREHQEREKQEQQQKLELSKMRKEKVNEVTSKLEQLQKALGDGEDKVAELLSNENLDGDWDDAEWDKRMQKLFDEEFYGREDANVADPAQEDLGEELAEETYTEEQFEEAPIEKKLSRKELKRKAEQFVEANENLLLEKTIRPTGFVYREVDPENFGLTSRDILLASDKDLNKFAGIKKLASYRERAKMEHDRKKYGKQKRVRQWRKEVFGTEEEPSNEEWEKAKLEAAKEAEATSTKPQKQKHKSKSKASNPKRRKISK